MLRGHTSLASVLQPGSANGGEEQELYGGRTERPLRGPHPCGSHLPPGDLNPPRPPPTRALHSLGLSISAPALPGTFTRGTPTRKHGGRVAGEGGGACGAGTGPECVSVSLRFSRRSDAVGTVCGVVCVVVPLQSSPAHREAATVAASSPSVPEISLLAGTQSQTQTQKADVAGEDTPEKRTGAGSGAAGSGGVPGSGSGNLFYNGPSSTSSSCSGVSSSEGFPLPRPRQPWGRRTHSGRRLPHSFAPPSLPPGTPPSQGARSAQAALEGQIECLPGAVQVPNGGARGTAGGGSRDGAERGGSRGRGGEGAGSGDGFGGRRADGARAVPGALRGGRGDVRLTR